MAVKSYNPDNPPPTPRPVKLIVVISFLAMIGLAIYSVLAGALVTTAPPAVEATTAATALSAPAATLVRLVAIEPSPIATTSPTDAPPTDAPPSPACPPAEPLPAGARVGWLARAAGCPEVLYARVNGEGRWVLKPDDFPDDLFAQLTEL